MHAWEAILKLLRAVAVVGTLHQTAASHERKVGYVPVAAKELDLVRVDIDDIWREAILL